MAGRMTSLLTWNIQYGKGVDGRTDLGRIAAVARRRGPVDVLCFQEVAINYAEMGGGETVDQTKELAALFPGYAAVFGAAVDRAGPNGTRRRFGNLLLSRLEVLDAVTHPLPRPAEPGVLHMARAALCCLVATPGGPLRVITTHLEYHSEAQRLAQTGRLRTLHAEAVANERSLPEPGPGAYANLPAAIGSVIGGDFNYELDSGPYRAMLAPVGRAAPALVDAWRARYGTLPHAPTCGIFDREQWQQGPHARDFWFVSAELTPRIKAVVVDTETDASDHQPVWLELD